jgi:hypothetical protein
MEQRLEMVGPNGLECMSGYRMLRAVFESLLLDGDLTIFNQFFKG